MNAALESPGSEGPEEAAIPERSGLFHNRKRGPDPEGRSVDGGMRVLRPGRKETACQDTLFPVIECLLRMKVDRRWSTGFKPMRTWARRTRRGYGKGRSRRHLPQTLSTNKAGRVVRAHRTGRSSRKHLGRK